MDPSSKSPFHRKETSPMDKKDPSVRIVIADIVDFMRTNPSGEKAPRNFGLTKREMDILTTIVAGLSNKEIARKFALSEDTVKHHLTNIFDKVGVASRLELALFAINNHLTDRQN